MKTLKPRFHADGRECCGNADWRGHLCEYHQGFDDGQDTAYVSLVQRVRLHEARLADAMPIITLAAKLVPLLGDTCRLDHNGNCQEHFVSAPCIVRELIDALAYFNEEPPF